MKLLICGLLLSVSSPAWASSFVGNGGNVGDIELTVALRQTQKTLDLIAKTEKDESFCVCPSGMERHSVCEPIRDLKNEERLFCAKFLREKAGTVARMVGTSEGPRVDWTHQDITVTEGGRLRAADAVANPAQGTLTLNQKRFLDLSPIERVFLLTHEYLHFVSLGGKNLSDEGSQGPFGGNDGGRRFINSVAAAVASTAQESKILSKEGRPLKRSRSDRSRWVSLTLVSGQPESSDSNFAHKKLDGAMLGVRYDFGGWGVYAEGGRLAADKTLQTQIKAHEERDLYAAGVYFRYHPFRDPLTYWGQSHFLVGAKLGQIKAKYALDDGFVQTLDSSSATGWGLDCQYYIPFKWGLWAFASLGYFDASIKYNQPLFEQSSIVSAGLGVAYGF